MPPLPVRLTGVLVLALYGVLYIGAGHLLGAPESEAWLGRGLKRRKR